MKRLCNRYNLISLFFVPVVLWNVDLIIHLLANYFPSTISWVATLTGVIPLCSYYLIKIMYKRFPPQRYNMFPHELFGMIGFLYGQPLYMIILNLAGKEFGSVSIVEELKALLTLTVAVPVTTIMISTYDATLLAIPIACLTMIWAGYRCRREYNLEEPSDNSGGKD